MDLDAIYEIENNNEEGTEEREEREDEDEKDEEEAEGEDDLDNDDEGDDDDDLEKAHHWGSLPEVCLWHVLQCLRDRDRVNAGLVCRHWHSVMRSPSLWRFRCFHLSGRLSKLRQTEHFSTVTYARCLGRYLERLEVCVCPSPRSSLVAQRLQRTVKGLFDELTRANTQLRTLCLVGLEMDRSCWTYGLRTSLVHSLIHFIHQGASQLTSVNLKGMRNSLQQGLELLSALSLSQNHFYPRGGISSLDLEEFFSGSLNVHLNPNMPCLMHNMQSLTSLRLSYSCLSDELLLALAHIGLERTHKSKTLQTFSLHCRSDEPHAQVVFHTSWATLTSSCPDLKVKFNVVQVINPERLARMLLPEIPLTEYNMTAFYSSEQDWSAKPVLSDMLPQYSHSLQHLTLDISNCNEALDEELVELVKVCECLEQLRVWAFLEISTVEELLQNRLSQKSCLNDIRVRIYSTNESTEEEEDELEEVLSRYQHLPADLDFFAVVYPFV